MTDIKPNCMHLVVPGPFDKWKVVGGVVFVARTLSKQEGMVCPPQPTAV